MEYLFWPFAFLMVIFLFSNFILYITNIHWFFIIQGVDVKDCRIISRLIGTKIFINEFVAYAQLGDIINIRNGFIANNTFDLYRNGTMVLEKGTAMIWDVSFLLKSIKCIFNFFFNLNIWFFLKAAINSYCNVCIVWLC